MLGSTRFLQAQPFDLPVQRALYSHSSAHLHAPDVEQPAVTDEAPAAFPHGQPRIVDLHHRQLLCSLLLQKGQPALTYRWLSMQVSLPSIPSCTLKGHIEVLLSMCFLMHPNACW